LPVTAHKSGEENMRYGKSELQWLMNRINFPVCCKDLTATVRSDIIKIAVWKLKISLAVSMVHVRLLSNLALLIWHPLTILVW
jgi:hypothetical protein